ncbi:tetratricopeptide repeat protein [Winogradskyella litorisediminis]|uniref:Tetratricopeptide repeat protein n=1 Tax=Winogradskyella litorisediminis TaxID=1156618 RepID=A0ABW3N929_9FLAO
MKQFITLSFALFLAITNAQSNFEKGMKKAFELWEADKTEEAENLFERIANAEKDNWLPHYYITQINSLKSWNVKDETILKAQLDKAQKHLDLAMSFSENNPELLVMQAQVYTNWVAFDGRTYGMKYAAKVSELYQKAKQLDPNNPRAAFGAADWEMNSAKYFGKDTAPYCEAISNSVKLFDSYKLESKYHPNWGKERAIKVSEVCK